MKGIGLEVAKNIILTGPQNVKIYDPDIVQLRDLGSNYYISEKDINKNRIDYSCISSLSKLNPYTKVEILNLDNQKYFYEELKKIELDIIVETEFKSESEIISLNEYCRNNKIKFIYGTALGLSGFIFSDFGKEHIIFDQNGIEPKRYLCQNISNNINAIITVVDEIDNPFNLETDDYIIFKNVKGMQELNDNKPRKIEVIDNNNFMINEDTRNYSKFEGNGDIYEIKEQIKKKYISFKEFINQPFNKILEEKNFTEQQENKIHQNKLYLSIILAMGEYLDNFKINLKELKNKNNIEEIVKNAEIKFNKMIEEEKKIGVNYERYGK